MSNSKNIIIKVKDTQHIVIAIPCHLKALSRIAINEKIFKMLDLEYNLKSDGLSDVEAQCNPELINFLLSKNMDKKYNETSIEVLTSNRNGWPVHATIDLCTAQLFKC